MSATRKQREKRLRRRRARSMPTGKSPSVRRAARRGAPVEGVLAMLRREIGR